MRITALLLLGLTSSALAFTPPVKPDPKLTPGDVLTTDRNVVCVPGYTKTVRNVPQSVKNEVYRRYGITSHAPAEYEVDHLISLELGGSNSIKNLFPEKYNMVLGARVKDRLENKLHSLVCKGQLDLRVAQQAIASDWVAAYQQYVGPLPGGASAGTPAPAAPVARPAPSPVPTAPPVQPAPAASNVYYPNCSAARAAGAAPLHIGDPGYRAGLDRDHDGVACE